MAIAREKILKAGEMLTLFGLLRAVALGTLRPDRSGSKPPPNLSRAGQSGNARGLGALIVVSVRIIFAGPFHGSLPRLALVGIRKGCIRAADGVFDGRDLLGQLVRAVLLQ